MEKEFKCRSCSKENTGSINTERFITKLDSFFASNDLENAENHIEYWESEAKSIGDSRGLLTVLNEELGFYRRTDNSEKGLKAVEKAISLIDQMNLSDTVSGATILINAATTLNCFGKPEKGIELYSHAEKIYVNSGKSNDFEYASLLNNKASSLYSMQKYDEAELCLNKAIEILKPYGVHDGEIAVSLITLAHLIYERNSDDVCKVEKAIDLSWEYINSKKQPHDANYAYILTKCAPSFRYFKREFEAEAMEEVAKEIYGGKI